MARTSGEGQIHHEAKHEIAAVLREAGYRVELEYSPHVHQRTIEPSLRRIDVALPDERIAIEVWLLHSVARRASNRARAAELMRNGWSVIDVGAGSWQRDNLLFAVQQARDPQHTFRAHIDDLSRLVQQLHRRIYALRTEADQLALESALIQLRLEGLVQVLCADTATHIDVDRVAAREQSEDVA